MTALYNLFRDLITRLHKEDLHIAGLVALLLLVIGGLLFAWFESVPVADSLWWSVVTMTTVGYGDISPASPGGRIVGTVLMLTGIGLLGLVTASIASILVENRILEGRGMKPIKASGHFVICGWGNHGEEVVAELKADAKTNGRSIVILAELDESPLRDRDVGFVRGKVDEESLNMASVAEANSCILLAGTTASAAHNDALTVMDVLTIKSLYPDVYVCAELHDAEKAEHATRAGADEIIIADELRGTLLAQAALDHGVTRVVSELVSNAYGQELYTVLPSGDQQGKSFIDVFCALKKERDVICLGIMGHDGTMMTNPDSAYLIQEGDRLLVIAEDRPTL